MNEFLMLASEDVKKIQSECEMIEDIRIELAEFLCEEPGSFKLEECFKVFWTFCSKFKSAVQENNKRRLQEAQIEQRRKQRVEMSQKKATLEPKVSSSNEMDDSHIMDMLLGDIRKGFPQQRQVIPPEFKVRRVRKTNLESGGELSRKNSKASINSEEDGSGSPMLSIRRRFGATDNPDGFTTDSPDITPNGTLRRRRSRITSDENNEDNLMDFLRQGSSHDSSYDSKDRRSWSGMEGNGNSLDRSWSRRSGRRRRPDLLSADFLSPDRERPASPMSPMMDRKVMTPNAGSESPKTPRQWKKKIEDWFHESEKEEGGQKIKSQRKVQERKKREYEMMDSDGTDSSRPSSMNLDTLHEAKTDTELLSKKPVRNATCLKPSTEIEQNKIQKEQRSSIEGQTKDKSRWRKSTMNVPNSTEAVEDEDSKRRSRKNNTVADVKPDDPKTPITPTISLGVIKENENNEIALRQSELPNLTKFTVTRTDSNSSTDVDKHPEYFTKEFPPRKWKNQNSSEKTEEIQKSDLDHPENSIKYTVHNQDKRYKSLTELPMPNIAIISDSPQDAEINIKQRSNSSSPTVDTDESDPTRLERMARKSQRYKKFVEATSMTDVSSSQRMATEELPEIKEALKDKKSDEYLSPGEKFDRFAAIRRTQRFKHSAKDGEKTNKIDEQDASEERGKEIVSGSIVSSNDRVPLERRSKRWGSDISKTDIDKILQDIEQTGNEIQEIGMQVEKNDSQSVPNLVTSPIDGVRSPLSEGEEVKPKDKSFKARLSRKLHSLAENIKLAARSNTDNFTKNIYAESQVLIEQDLASSIEESDLKTVKPIPETPETVRKTCKTLEESTSVDASTTSSNAIMHTDSCENVQESISKINEADKKPTRISPEMMKKGPSIDSIASSSPISIPSPSIRRRNNRSPETDGDTEKDEGFEETQSLISDTHSQGTGSNCNYENESAEVKKSESSKTKSGNTKKSTSKPQEMLKKQPRPIPKSILNRSNKSTIASTVAAYQARPAKKNASNKSITRKPTTNLVKPKSPSKNSLRGSNRSLRTSNSSIASDKSKSSVIFRPYGATTNHETPQRSPQSSISGESTHSSKSASKKTVKNEIKRYTSAIKNMTTEIDKNLVKSKAIPNKSTDSKKDVKRPALRSQRSDSGRINTDSPKSSVEKSASFNAGTTSVRRTPLVKRASSVRVTPDQTKSSARGDNKVNSVKQAITPDETDSAKPKSPARRSNSKNLSFMRATSSSAAKQTNSSTSGGDTVPVQRVKIKAGTIKPLMVKTSSVKKPK